MYGQQCDTAADKIVEVDRKTILVVEDDPRVRQVIASGLQYHDYIVFEADSGPVALDVLNDVPAVDLVFTDMVMPGGMSGSDLAQEVWRQWPGIKILFTSGYPGDPGIDGHVFEEHADWVCKPYKISAIAQKVRDILDR